MRSMGVVGMGTIKAEIQPDLNFLKPRKTRGELLFEQGVIMRTAVCSATEVKNPPVMVGYNQVFNHNGAFSYRCSARAAARHPGVARTVAPGHRR